MKRRAKTRRAFRTTQVELAGLTSSRVRAVPARRSSRNYPGGDEIRPSTSLSSSGSYDKLDRTSQLRPSALGNFAKKER